MSTFVKFTFRGGQAGGEQIIKPELSDDVREPVFEQEGSQPMGLGWKIARAPGSELLVWTMAVPARDWRVGGFAPREEAGIVLFSIPTSFESSVSVALATDMLKLMLKPNMGSSPRKRNPAGDPDRSIRLQTTRADTLRLARYGVSRAETGSRGRSRG